MSDLMNSVSGKAWRQQLPLLIDELCARWNLVVAGEPFTGGSASHVIPVHRNGQTVVLKIQLIHEECLYEADALLQWRGNSAIKLLEHDREKGALLLELCSPGIALADSDLEDKLSVIISLLPSLWLSAKEPFKTLEEEARGWQSSLLSKKDLFTGLVNACDVEATLRYIDELLSTKQPQFIVNQDMHGGNILSAEREPWLLIDPKPLLGEKAFSLASIIRSKELGHSKDAVIDRLNRLSRELDIDRDRARKWCIVQTLAWSGGAGQHMLEVVRWLLDDK